MKTITTISRMIVQTIILFLSFIFSAEAQTTQVAVIREWVQHFANQDSIMESPSCKDINGNYYVAGYTLDTNTGPDIVVAKYDRFGTLLWSNQYSGSNDYARDQATTICVDDSLNVYVCGFQFTDSVNGFDFVIIKYNSSGSGQWVSTYNGNYSMGSDIPVAIAENSGSIYVTGTSQDSSGLLDIVTLMFDSAGNQSWVNQYDYVNLYDVPRAMKINPVGVTITGGSQNSIFDWDYLTLVYDFTGTPSDTIRVTNTGNSFDRANAVALTDSGTAYITGRGADTTQGYNIRTVKIDSTGSLLWIRNFNLAGFDDEATAMAVDTNENIYITGYGRTGAGDATSNYVTLKYDSAGNLIWSQTFNGSGTGKDVAWYVDVDSIGTVYVTGETWNGSNSDFGTIAYDSAGAVLWQDMYDGNYHGNDMGMHIEHDGDGIVYVSGQSQTDTSKYEYITIQYDTKHFISPPDTDSTGTSLAYYPNYGQIIDTDDSVRMDIKYYSVNHYPYLYFFKPLADSGYKFMSYVFSRVDTDTTTADTLHRVDLTFELHQEKVVPASETTKPFSVNKNDGGWMNYYLPQCPDGISVQGFQKLLYPDVFNYTDILFYGNGAGMKYYIIMKPGADYDVGLNFDGQDSITVVGDTLLNIHTSIGTYSYPRPEVYQIDANGNYVALNWQAEYADWGNGRVGFTMQSFDANLTLVIKLSNIPEQVSVACTQNNLNWSTYIGTAVGGRAMANTSDNAGNVYVCGVTSNSNNLNFPIHNAIQTNWGGGNFTDCFIARFNPTSSSALFPNNIEWCTYYGAGGNEYASSIAENGAGYVYVVGATQNNSPIYNIASAAGGNFNQTSQGPWDGFILKINDNVNPPTIAWASYISGSGEDRAMGVAVNKNTSANNGDVYVVGFTTSPGGTATGAFPLTSSLATNSYNQTQNNSNHSVPYNAFVMRFDDTDNLLWSSLYGGDNWTFLEGVAVFKSNDNVVITGRTNSQNPNISTAIVDAQFANSINHNLQLTHSTTLQYFHTINSAQFDALVVSFNSNDQLIWSTCFGGTGEDLTLGNSVVVTNNPFNRDIYILGRTDGQPGFPLLSTGQSYYQNTYGGNSYDYFIARFDADDYSQVWTTYFGGNGYESMGGWISSGFAGIGAITADNNGNIYIAGSTLSGTYSTAVCTTATVGGFPYCISNTCFYDCTFGGNVSNQEADAFVASFNSAGDLVWSTFLGATSSVISSLNVSYYGNTTWLNFTGSDAIGNNYQFPTFSYSNPQPFYFMATPATGAEPPVVGRFDVSCLITGINDEEIIASGDLLLFPNPANNQLNISINLKAASPLTIKIYDELGRSVYSRNLKGMRGVNTISLSLSNYSEGIYFVQVQTKDFVKGEKIILEK